MKHTHIYILFKHADRFESLHCSLNTVIRAKNQDAQSSFQTHDHVLFMDQSGLVPTQCISTAFVSSSFSSPLL